MALYKNLVKKIAISANCKTKQKEYQKKGTVPIVDQGQGLIGGYSDNSGKIVRCNLPVIVFGDHTKCVKYVSFPFGAGADGVKILEPREGVDCKYLFYGTKYLTYRMVDKGYARHYQHLEKMQLRIPETSEQERIVSRIEELFSELDKAVETLQTTKKQLAVYRQAVLNDLFKGLDSYPVSDICKHITDGDHMPPPKSKTGIPFIMISNINGNIIDWNGVNYVDENYYRDIGEKRTPQRGDVLYTVTGSYGIPVLVDFDKSFCFQRHIALLRPNPNMVISKYLFYALQVTDVFLQATKGATGTAQKTVGLGVLRKICIPYTPDQTAQKRIVAEIEKRISMCDSIDQVVQKGLTQAEAMRQSILKEAFEGRLI